MDNNLRAARKAAGLTQQQVADIFKNKYGKSSIVMQSISSWERSVYLPELENAFILAKIYNCKVDDLFSLD